MPLEIQFALKSNPLYIKYLRENNIWYKRLMRHPETFKDFVNEMRIKYQLRPSDKINKVMDTINIVSNLFSSMV